MNQNEKKLQLSIDIEQAVLGAIIINGDVMSKLYEKLNPIYFCEEKHQRIYNAILKLYNSHYPIDLITVAHKLNESCELENIGGEEYLSLITRNVQSSSNVEFHSRIILHKYLQRALISFSKTLHFKSSEGCTDVIELMQYAEKEIYEIFSAIRKHKLYDMKTSVLQALKGIEVLKKTKGKIAGIPTGFHELDRITGGWQQSEMIVIAARPAMGNTAFLVSLINHAAVNCNKAVAVFSLQMTYDRLAIRLIAAYLNIEIFKLINGKLTEEEMFDMHARLSNLTEAPIFIDDTPEICIYEFRSKCIRMKRENNVELIIVDYLQLMSIKVENVFH